MEIFSLMAKLALNTEEYEKALSQAESEGGNLQDPEPPSLDLDTSSFDSKILSAESTDVDDPDEPELDLDKSEFDTAIADAEEAEVNDPDTPSLDLDTGDFKDALSDAEGESKGFQVTIGNVLDEIKGAIVTAGIGAAIKGVVDSLSEAVNLAATLADDVDKGSRRLNISAEAYQEWSHALSQSGANINDFNRGILSMNKYMSGADVTEDVSNAFESLGMSAKVANGEITSTEDLLVETVKALADFSGTSEERGVLATAIFGRGGNTLNALFDSGSDGIQQLIDEAHELGLVMTDEEISNNVAYGDALANMQASLTAFKTSLVTDLMPVLTDVLNSASKIIAVFNWRSGDTPLSKQFEDIDNGSMDALASINMTESVAGNLADKLIAMGDASKLTAEQQAVWKGTAEELIGLIPSLSGIIDTDTLSIKGNKDAINENIHAWANLARERALAQAKEEKQRALIEKNKDAIEAQVDMNVKAAEAEAARSQAIDEVNKVLEKYGRSERLSEDATAQDITQLRSDIGFDRGNLELQKELAQAEDIYGKPLRELSDLQAQFESYQAQLAAGQAEYEAWATAAEQIFGVASESATTAEADVNAVNTAINNLPKNKQVLIDILARWDLPVALPKAKGDWDVPWDNYPALLHRGERVLTASQARQDSSGNNSIDIAGLSEAIESSIRAGMAGATVQSFLNGKDITRAVSKELGNQMKARRFSS